MTTATPTRTLADAYRERLAQADPSDKLYTAINEAIGDMTQYHETDDLRPSEEEWIGKVHTEAIDAAKAAAIDAVVAVFGRELPKLLPAGPGELPKDGMVPPDLWGQGGDNLNGDAELAADQ